MDTSLSRALTKLPEGAMLCVRHSRGKGIAVFHGQAWITQEGDSRDVVLGAGESFALDRAGVAIVQALGDTNVLVFETNPDEVLAPHAAVSVEGRSRGIRDTEVLEAGPMTSYELHRLAREMRKDAIARAARRLVEAFRVLWTRLWARA